MTGQFTEAEATLGKEPALSSPFPAVHFILGTIAGQKGQLDQAAGHFEKSLAVNKSYIPARIARSEFIYRPGSSPMRGKKYERLLNCRREMHRPVY